MAKSYNLTYGHVLWHNSSTWYFSLFIYFIDKTITGFCPFFLYKKCNVKFEGNKITKPFKKIRFFDSIKTQKWWWLCLLINFPTFFLCAQDLNLSLILISNNIFFFRLWQFGAKIRAYGRDVRPWALSMFENWSKRASK